MIKFSSKYHDQETHLVYYGFRYYNSDTGKWLSRDPLGEIAGVNLTLFVYNEPLNYVDLYGLIAANPDMPVKKPPSYERPGRPVRPGTPVKTFPQRTLPRVPIGPIVKPILRKCAGIFCDIIFPPPVGVGSELLDDRGFPISDIDPHHPPIPDPNKDPDPVIGPYGDDEPDECSLIRATGPGKNGSSCCWFCEYRCTGRNIIGGGSFISRYKSGECPKKVYGYVPGYPPTRQGAKDCEKSL